MSGIPKTSFAMVQTGVRTLEPRDLPIPDIDEDSALLRVEACGICGSDYEQYEGKLRVEFPVIPGHEPLGIIAKIGDRAAKRWGVDVGDRVAIETMLSCRFCHPCVTGSYHLCNNRLMYSFIPLHEPPALWGAYSQYMFLHRNSLLHKVDKSIPPEIGVMFNPLGAGYRWGVEIPNTKPGDTIVILGPGQRGLSCVVAYREAGAKTIIVAGLSADRQKMEVAKAFGADVAIDVEKENSVARVREITNGARADVVIDVSSYATQPIVDALSMVRPGGTVVLAGVKGFKEIPKFVSDIVVLKEINVRGAIGVTSSGYRNAIRTIESGRVPLERMHTHRFDLADAELAIRMLAREIPGDESIHSCLIPPA